MYQQELKRHTRQQYDELNDRIRVEWESRAKEFASDDLNNNFMNAVAYMFAIPCRVLIEQFGWKPVRFANCPQTKTERLAVGTKVIVHTFDRHGNHQSEEGIVVRRSPKRKALAFRDYWDGDNEVRDIRKESDVLCYTEAGV